MSEVRVLQVLGHSAGGIGRHVGQIVAGLDAREGLRIDIAAPPDMQVPLPKSAIEVDVPQGLSNRHVTTVRRIGDVISSGGYSVVHAHGLRAGIDGSLAARRCGVPALVTLHNLIRPETSGRVRSLLFRRAESVVLALADRVFAVSEEMAEQLRRRAFAGEKVELMLIGVAEPGVARTRSEVRSELGVENGSSLVVTIARLAPQKALDVLVDAVARLPGVTLAIIGEGHLRSDLERMVTARNVADRVHLLGRRDEVGDYLAAADIFAMSSTWEARALAAQEAILAGVPVVTTDVGGMNELVTDGISGRLIPPGDPVALADALADVMGDPEKGRRFAEVARRNLLEGFSLSAMLDRLEREYRKAAAGAR